MNYVIDLHIMECYNMFCPKKTKTKYCPERDSQYEKNLQYYVAYFNHGVNGRAARTKDAKPSQRDELIAVLDNCCSYESNRGRSPQVHHRCGRKVEFSAKQRLKTSLNKFRDMDECKRLFSDANIMLTLKQIWNEYIPTRSPIIF